MPLVLVILASSCTRYYYIPNSQNVPLFKERNEYRFMAGSGGIGDEIKTTELQAAYSITDHVAVSASFLGAKGGSQTHDTANNWGEGNYLEGALGYYRPMDYNCVFEMFAGMGGGSQHHQYGSSARNNGKADLSLSKFFIQPAFGYTHKYFDVALSMRISSLSFYKIDRQIDSGERGFGEVRDIQAYPHSFLLEPAFTIRGGWKYVKLQVQWVFSQNLSHPNLSFQNSNLNVGLYISLARRYRG